MTLSNHGERFRYYRTHMLPRLAAMALKIGGLVFLAAHPQILLYALAIPFAVIHGVRIVSFAFPPPYGAATRCLITRYLEMNADFIERGIKLYYRFLMRWPES